MNLKYHFMDKLRSRIWKDSREIIRLRRRALDAGKLSRYMLHDEIDTLKMEREKDVIKLNELCESGDGILEEVKAGVEEAVDDVKHTLAGEPEPVE